MKAITKTIIRVKGLIVLAVRLGTLEG